MSLLIRIIGPTENNEVQQSPPDGMDLEEMKMEDLIHQIFTEEEIIYDTWQTSRNGKYFIVEFPVMGAELAEKILDRLSYYNVGKTEDSNIMVINPAALVCKREKPRDIPVKHFQKFVNSLKSRLTVAQVYHAISNQGNFNFNYFCFLLCAAIVADIALVTDSAASVFASMLLSPLMEPIICIIFGLSLRESQMTKKGFRNTSVSLAICIIVGITFGIIAHFISMFQGVSPYPTGQMSSRGDAKSLIGSVIVASASGVSVSFAILSNSLAAMIGNAISLSLLPPSVNCGQLFLLSVIALIDRPYVMKNIEPISENGTLAVTMVQCQYWWIKDYKFTYVQNACDAPIEFAILGVVSFGLTLLNILLIIVTGYSVNRLKDLVPQSFTNSETRRFYTKDLKEVRDNYDCMHGLEAADLAAQAYQEYLRLSIVPADADLTPEDNGELTAEFRAVMEEIGNDQYMQTVSSWANKGQNSFMAEFNRATEVLTHGGDLGTNDGTYRNSIPRLSMTSAAARQLRLRQLAAAAEVDEEEEEEDEEAAAAKAEDAAGTRHNFQQHRRPTRQARPSIWRNILSKRSSSSATAHTEQDNAWLSTEPTPHEMEAGRLGKTAGVTSGELTEGPVFRLPSSRIPSSESGDISPSNTIATERKPIKVPKGDARAMSRSVNDVSAGLPKNKSLASVNTIGGKFEVTPTIKKPQSTKNLSSYTNKGA